jgi:hypothetical protein
MMFSKSLGRAGVTKTCFCALLLFAGLSSAADDYFPLSVGRYWTYLGGSRFGGGLAGLYDTNYIKYTITLVSKSVENDTTKYMMRVDYCTTGTSNEIIPIWQEDPLSYERRMDSAGIFDSFQIAAIIYREVGDTLLLESAWPRFGPAFGLILEKIWHSMNAGDSLKNQMSCSLLRDFGVSLSGKVFNKITIDSATSITAVSSEGRSRFWFADGIGYLGKSSICSGGDLKEETGESLIDYGMISSIAHYPIHLSPVAQHPDHRFYSEAFDCLGRSLNIPAFKKNISGIVIARDKEGPGCRVVFPAFEDKASAGR